MNQHAAGSNGALPVEDKLEILRRLDFYRHWRSLDDKRYCIGCGRIITGHEIRVVGQPDSAELPWLRCPTAGCKSVPMDWVLPTDEVLAYDRSGSEINGAA